MASESSYTSIRVASGLPDNLPAAELRSISLRNLRDGSTSESTKLLDAAIHDGFFYLDLTDHSEEMFLNRVDEIFAMSKAIFDLDESIKMHFDIDLLGPFKVNG
jgi:isopenicillin N synthase-like dioxygenase